MVVPYYYMPMPVNTDGDGPADERETAHVLHEVWDGDCLTICRCCDEEMARWVADQLNLHSVSSAYELAALWHDKNARGCQAIADDDPRIEDHIRSKAREAAKHHAASAAGLRLAAIEHRRRNLPTPTAPQ